MKEPKDIPVGEFPTDIAVDRGNNKAYVVNSGSNTVSVINGTTDTNEAKDIFVGRNPSSIAVNSLNDKIYILNRGSDSVSVINGTTGMKGKDTVLVGEFPTKLALNEDTQMIYVVNNNFSTVSVIDGFSDKVAAGVTLNTHPANSGTIMCGKKEYPTNIYLYVDAGTECVAQPTKDFQFSGWVENLKGNSTIPIGDSSNLTVNRYGTFTANFKPISPADPTQFLFPLYGIIASSLFGWSIPSIMGKVKERTQLKHLKECINQIGKLDKNAIEEKIIGYYVDGKINEDHRQLLKDKISEYYENVKDYHDTIDY